MGTSKRATVYLDSDLHRALRVKAAQTDSSISVLVNEAVRRNLVVCELPDRQRTVTIFKIGHRREVYR